MALPEWLPALMNTRTVITVEDLQASRDRAWAAQRALSTVYSDPNTGMSKREWTMAYNALDRAVERINAKIDERL